MGEETKARENLRVVHSILSAGKITELKNKILFIFLVLTN